jgi:hypothetical protein
MPAPIVATLLLLLHFGRRNNTKMPAPIVATLDRFDGSVVICVVTGSGQPKQNHAAFRRQPDAERWFAVLEMFSFTSSRIGHSLYADQM